MAMTALELQQVMDKLQQSQTTALATLQRQQMEEMAQQQTVAIAAASSAQRELTEAMQKFFTDNKTQPQPSPPRTEPTEKEKEATLERKPDIKLNEKSYKRPIQRGRR